MAPSKTIPWRKDIFTPAFTGLLDQSFASGATAAYSLRRLKSSATKAVRVREDSGNTETDIGFSGGALDETALLNHVGSNNGFVTKWYDQSGNGNDASNSTASEQPQIVSSGSVIKENGKPALEFDGSDDFFKIVNNEPIYENFTMYSEVYRADWSISVRQGIITTGEDRSKKPLNFDLDNGFIKHFRGAAAGDVLQYDATSETGWVSFAVTQERTSSSNVDLELYIDKNIEDTNSGDYENMDISKLFQIAANSGKLNFQGSINEVLLFDEKLLSDDISKIVD